MSEYLKTCCFSMNVAFKSMEAFQQGQEYHESDIWWKYEEFGIDILDFSDTSMNLLYLGIKKYIINMISTLLRLKYMKYQDFGRLASKSLDPFRWNALTGATTINSTWSWGFYAHAQLINKKKNWIKKLVHHISHWKLCWDYISFQAKHRCI